MNLTTQLGPVSKAVAGAIVALIIAGLAKADIAVSAEVGGAIGVIIDAAIVALIGYLTVYFAPRNTGVK